MLLAIAGLTPQTGKTMLSLNLGAALATQGNSVLIIDGDPRGALSEMGALSESGIVFDRLGRQVMRSTEIDGLQILTGFGAAFETGEDSEERLWDKVQQLSSEFDFILFDTPPRRCKVVSAILEHCNLVFVPIREERRSFADLPAFLRLILEARDHNPKLRFGGLIANRQGEGADASREARNSIRELQREIENAVLPFAVPMHSDLNEARSRQLPILLSQPASPLVGLFADLARHIAQLAGTPIPGLVGATHREGSLQFAETIIDVPTSAGAAAPEYQGGVGSGRSSGSPPPVGTTSAQPGPIRAILNWLSGFLHK